MSIAEAFDDQRGYGIYPDLVPASLGEQLWRGLAQEADAGVGSRRIPPDHEAVRRLLASSTLSAVLEAILGPGARPVRVLSFDKTASRNWAVPWHQDRIIAVAERHEIPGVRGWTTKAGVPHCEAPVALLETMLTVRWHLDPSGPEDGGLRVLPGSHRLGRLSQSEIRALLTRQAPRDLAVPTGGVLLMRPLLVHGSLRRTTVGRRRVLHVELACGDPPAPLGWFYRSKNSNSR